MEYLEFLIETIRVMSDTHFPDADYTVDLKKLAEEIEECKTNPSMEEYADCLIALLSSFRKVHGSNYRELLYAAGEKVHTNTFKREWVKNPNGTYSHKKN